MSLKNNQKYEQLIHQDDKIEKLEAKMKDISKEDCKSKVKTR